MSNVQSLNYKARVTNLDSGIKKDEVGHVVQALNIALAGTYTLYLKTQNFHWNVTGPHFYSLHQLSDQQYHELGEAVDTIAERIRALGHPVVASFTQFQKLSRLSEVTEIHTTEEMVQQLASDHESVASFLKEAFAVAEKAYDYGTCDMFSKFMTRHEHHAWMLHATLG